MTQKADKKPSKGRSRADTRASDYKPDDLFLNQYKIEVKETEAVAKAPKGTVISGLITDITDEDWQKAEQYFDENPHAIKRSKYVGGAHEDKADRWMALDDMDKPSLERSANCSFIKVADVIYAIKNGECLGEGQACKVRIIQKKTGENFAIKMERLQDSRLTRQREKDILVLLGRYHGSVDRPYHYYGPQGKKMYMVIDLKLQKELLNYLYQPICSNSKDKNQEYNNRALSEEQKLIIAIKITQCLKELHDLNIVHGDINPRNFMVNEQGESIVISAIDFELSMQLKEGQNTGLSEKLKATPDYVAPEAGVVDEWGRISWSKKENGKIPLSFASDIYGIGRLFEKDLKLGILENREKDSDYHAFYEKILNPDPTQRYLATELIAHLITQLEKQPDLSKESLALIANQNSAKTRPKL